MVRGVTDDRREGSQENRLARLVHLTLLAGVTTSGVSAAVGPRPAFCDGATAARGAPRRLPRLWATALRGDGLSILYLALLLLMATPPLRVAALAVGWAIQGSRQFALVAFAVLGLLALSVAIGVG